MEVLLGEVAGRSPNEALRGGCGSTGVGCTAGVGGREAVGRRMCEAEGATRASAQDVGEVVDVVGVVGG
jgi:hypothetical protein